MAPEFVVMRFKAFSILSIAFLLGCDARGTTKSKSKLTPKGQSSSDVVLALTTDLDLGIVKSGEFRTASFRIANTGNSSVELVKGLPTCACSVATLSDALLEPGSAATLTMTLSARGRVGPFSASVVVAVRDEKWAQSFTAGAMAAGSEFVNGLVALDANKDNDKAVLIGTVFSTEGVPTCEIQLIDTSVSSSLSQLLSIEKPALQASERKAGYFRHSMAINIALADSAKLITDVCSGKIVIHVKADDWEQTHERYVVVKPRGIMDQVRVP